MAFGVGRSNGATFEFQKSKMAADGHLGCPKMAVTPQLPIEVIFGFKMRFPAELRFSCCRLERITLASAGLSCCKFLAGPVVVVGRQWRLRKCRPSMSAQLDRVIVSRPLRKYMTVSANVCKGDGSGQMRTSRGERSNGIFEHVLYSGGATLWQSSANALANALPVCCRAL